MWTACGKKNESREMKKHNQRYWREKRLKGKIARDHLNWKKKETIFLNMETKRDSRN